jgi:nicotinamidase-related amidase
VAHPARNADLHGNVPEASAVALLMIDVISDFDFEGGPELLKAAKPMAARVARLKARARELGIPAIYVNDNFGRWRSDFRQLVEHCGRRASRGRAVTRVLRPRHEDYFILKPKHSGFFATALDTLLRYLGVQTLILVGLTTDNCVLFTASDAYLRDFCIYVPRDCVAAIEERHGRQALRHLERVLHANTQPSPRLALACLLRAHDGLHHDASTRLTAQNGVAPIVETERPRFSHDHLGGPRFAT